MTSVGQVSFQAVIDTSNLRAEVAKVANALARESAAIKVKLDTGNIQGEVAKITQQIKTVGVKIPVGVAVNSAEAQQARQTVQTAVGGIRVQINPEVNVAPIRTIKETVDQVKAASAAAGKQIQDLQSKFGLSAQEAKKVQSELLRAEREAAKLAQSAAKVEFRRQQQEAAAVAKELKQAQVEAEKLQKAQAAAAQRQSRDREVLTGVKFDSSEVRKIESSIAKVRSETQKADQVAALLRDKYKLTDDEVRRVQGSLTGVVSEQGKFNAAVAGFASAGAFIALNAAIQAVTTSLRALVGVFAQSLDIAGQFDAAGAAVRTLGVSTDQLEPALRAVNAELKGQASTLELLEGSYDIVSAGFSDAADVAKIAEASVRGAVGGFSDFATVSDAATSVLNAYGQSADEAASFIDKFIATQNQGKITVDQYAQQIGQLAPTAALAGVGIDELNGFIATATAQGVPVQSTFAGIRQALAAVLKPSSDAAKFAKELGIGFDAATLGSIGLEGILGQLNATGQDSADNLLRLFGSVEAVAAIAPSTGENIDILRKNIDASINSAGLAAAAFEEVSNTIPGLQKAIGNQLNDAFKALGNSIQPIERAVLGLASELLSTADVDLSPLTEAAERFASVITGNPELIENITNAISKLANTAVDQLAGIVDAFTVLAASQESVDGLTSALEILIIALGRTAQGIVGFIGLISELFEPRQVLPGVEFSLAGILSNLKLLIPGVETAVTVFNTFETAKNIVIGFANAFQSLVDTVIGAVPGLETAIAALERLQGIEPTTIEPSVAGNALSSQSEALKAFANVAEQTRQQVNNGDPIGPTFKTPEQAQSAADALKEYASTLDATLSEIETRSLDSQRKLVASDAPQTEIAKQERVALGERLKAREDFLKDLEALSGRDGLSVEDASAIQGRILATEQAIANDRLAIQRNLQQEEKRIETERIQAAQEAERARVKAIEDSAALEIATLRIAAEEKTKIIDQQIQSAKNQLSLLSADQSVVAASIELEKERLETAIAQSEAVGNTVEAERLRGELIRVNRDAVAQEFEFKRQQLEIEGAIAAAEAQRAVVLADIAVREAEINLTKAQGLGASEQEIANLKAIIALRQQDAAAAQTAVAVTSELQALKSERLDLEQGIAEENQKQAELTKEAAEAQKAGVGSQRESASLAGEESSAKQRTAELSKQIAEAEQRRASALVSALRTQQQSNAEALKELETVRERFREARKAGLFEGVGAEFEQASKQLESILQRGGSLKDLIKFAQDTDSEVAKQLLSAIGRQDVIALIDADAQFKEPLEAGAQFAGTELESGIIRGAKEGASLLAAAIGGSRAGGSIQSLRVGGVVDGAPGGVAPVQLHRDEFAFAPVGTRVVSQAESRRLVQQHLASAMPVPTLNIPPMGGGASVQRAFARGMPSQVNAAGLEKRFDKLISLVSEAKTRKDGGQTNYFTVAEESGATRMAAEMRRLSRRVNWGIL
jgi:TP901 family phage tail tape measure protein